MDKIEQKDLCRKILETDKMVSICDVYYMKKADAIEKINDYKEYKDGRPTVFKIKEIEGEILIYPRNHSETKKSGNPRPKKKSYMYTKMVDGRFFKNKTTEEGRKELNTLVDDFVSSVIK